MSIEGDILEWALTRPAWQQQVLVSLAEGKDYSQQEIAELADAILTGTADAPSQDAKGLALKSDTPETVSLTKVHKVIGVNALINDGSLDFAPSGLTVVFGANGSGKSGYARLIKHLVGARHSSEILPDVFSDNPLLPSAELVYTAGAESVSEAFPGAASSRIRKVSFYDEHCGDAYLTKQSTITYRPSALGVIDGLIGVCDSLRLTLQERIDTLEAGKLQLSIDPTTVAGTFFSSLNATTSDPAIDTATILPPTANEDRAKALHEEARLKATDPGKEQALLRSQASAIRDLRDHALTLQRSLDSAAQQTLTLAIELAVSKREAANIAVTESMAGTDLPGVGAAAWRSLWEAAREYSSSVAYPDHNFPHTVDGARCVLCQQELGADGTEHLRRFDGYMRDTTEQEARTAEGALALLTSDLRSLAAVTPRASAALASLGELDPKLAASARELLASFDQQRSLLLSYVTEGDPAPVPFEDSPVLRKLEEIANALETRAAQTDVRGFQKALEAATRARKEADASALLAKSVKLLKQEVMRQASIQRLRAARTKADTSSITQKSSALARSYATNLIVDRFTRETDRLRLTRVTLKDLGGRKGQMTQQPDLLGAKHKTATAVSVLSEGEQTALGLAGFFTEAHFDASKSGLVLDDPVTSLDHVRRFNVAQRLVELAADRQVVVFSHEISFIGDLVKVAHQAGVQVTPRAIERVGKTQPGLVRQELPWRAKDFGSRRNQLDVDLKKLEKDRPALAESEYEQRVAAWAGNLSETWERCVSSEVVNKVFDIGASEVRPMAFRLLASITPADNEDFQQGYSASSKWARRHDNAPVTNYVPPEIDEMQFELERITKWQKRLKGYLN
ncbi:hypothetical protein [Blastococcus sp. LR1]|uniref:AAA family ATPase n=1 Tax=Blastococcus sp. LR1 TaxID=2877000 RepID=UPI001CCC3E71|nr:hypothetical protein [Blastococcus sp. LR1]MCA0146382.1 hypothetical protein [Blastococcus sp. LR1]